MIDMDEPQRACGLDKDIEHLTELIDCCMNNGQIYIVPDPAIQGATPWLCLELGDKAFQAVLDIMNEYREELKRERATLGGKPEPSPLFGTP